MSRVRGPGRVLITGMSGTGKSTVVDALAERGFVAVDLDAPGWSHEVAVAPDELTGLGGGRDWVWREERIRDLLAGAADPLFLGGCSPNQGRFYSQLDQVVLLTAPPELIVERLASRTTNPFGKQPDEVTRVLQLQREIEPLLRRGATAVIDTRRPLPEVVTAILALAGEAAR